MTKKKKDTTKRSKSSSTSKRGTTSKETPNNSIHQPTEKKSRIRNPTNSPAGEMEAQHEDANMYDEEMSSQKEVRFIDNESCMI